MTDNIADSAPETPVTPPSHQPHMMTSLAQIGEQISKHYGKGFEGLRYRFPMQMTDGAIVEFVDVSGETPAIIASARLRFRNRVLVQENGDMYAEILMSDLAFSRSEITVKFPAHPAPEASDL